MLLKASWERSYGDKMDNEELQTRIQHLGQKVRELLGHYKDQKKLIQHLQEEKTRVRQQATNGRESANNFPNSPEIGTITKDECQIRALVRSIDSYIRDIDKSIAHLERPQ